MILVGPVQIDVGHQD